MERAVLFRYRYLIALGLVAAAIAARLALAPYVESRLPFVLLMLALVVVSASAGIGPGFLALGIGTLATMWFVLAPTGSLYVQELPMQITVVAYLIVGTGVVLLGERFRRARQRTAAIEYSLGNEFKRSGEVYVRTSTGLRLARTRALSEDLPADYERPDETLGRILSEILPNLPGIAPNSGWELRADGRPVATVKARAVAPKASASGKPWMAFDVEPLDDPSRDADLN